MYQAFHMLSDWRFEDLTAGDNLTGSSLVFSSAIITPILFPTRIIPYTSAFGIIRRINGLALCFTGTSDLVQVGRSLSFSPPRFATSLVLPQRLQRWRNALEAEDTVETLQQENLL